MLRTTIASSSRTPLGARSISTKRRTARDAALRLAVEMYHITPSFLPTESSSPALEQHISSSVLITSSDPRRSDLARNNGLTFRHAAQIIDSSSRDSLLPLHQDKGNYDHLVDRDPKTAAELLERVPPPSITRGPGSSPIKGTQPRRQQQHQEGWTEDELPPIEDRETTARLVVDLSQSVAGSSRQDFVLNVPSPAEAVDAQKGRARGTGSASSGLEGITNQVKRYTPGGAARHGVIEYHSLNSRQARVRDALFGTIAGELPGLDVIRERERERRAALRAESAASGQDGAQPARDHAKKAKAKAKGKKATGGKK